MRSPWWLVAGVFVVLAVSSGFGFYNLSVYMNALAAERSFAVADLSGAVALMFVVSGAAGVAVGRLIERVDVRWVMAAGAAVGGGALGLVGTATEIWQVWLLYALFGVGNAGVSLVPGTTVVTRWFPGANRSIALSVASTGLSTGGVLLTPACASAVHYFGVQTALPWFGTVYFLTIAPTALLLVRSWPAGGAAALRQTARSADVRDSLRSQFFVGATAAYVAIMAAQVGAIAHLFNHVEKIAGHLLASSCVSALAATSIVGRLLGGFFLGRGGASRRLLRGFTMINLAGQGLGLAVLGAAESPPVLVGGSVLFGATIGNLLMLQPLLLAEAFGVERYARLFSVGHALSTLGVAGGPFAMGLVHDGYGYPLAFGAGVLACVVALLLLWAAGPLPQPRALR